MGQHDPVDGYVTYSVLQRTALALGADCRGIVEAVGDFATMIDPKRMVSSDPLGIGGLLVDGCLLAEMGSNHELAALLLAAAAAGLRYYVRKPELRAEADNRLAFRELGLAIGLAAVEKVAGQRQLDPAFRAGISEVLDFVPLRDQIVRFWVRGEHRQARAWREHQDINDVMLATSLVPEGFLSLAPASGANPLFSDSARQ
jgi:hypothetical protein